MRTARRVLVLGANGRFGQAAVAAFAAAHWEVIAQARAPKAASTEQVTWLTAEASDKAAILNAGEGAQVVVNAWSPVYTHWQSEFLPLTKQAIAIASGLRATLMFPGNIYNFGEDFPERLEESTPQTATTVKGRIRIEAEELLRDASRAGVQVVIVRAGDFFGVGKGAWFDLVITKEIAKGKLQYPGPPEAKHAWAYLPDLAQTFALLAEKRKELAPFEVLHFPGHTLTGDEMINAIKACSAKPLRVSTLPWTLIRAMGLVVPMMREVAEIRHFWQRSHELITNRLTTLVPNMPHTNLQTAVKKALKS